MPVDKSSFQISSRFTKTLAIRALSTDNAVLLKELAEFSLKNDSSAFSLKSHEVNRAPLSKRKGVTAEAVSELFRRGLSNSSEGESSSNTPLVLGAYSENGLHHDTLVASLVIRPLWGLPQAFELQTLALSPELSLEERTYVGKQLIESATNFHRRVTGGTGISLFAFRGISEVSTLLKNWGPFHPKVCAVPSIATIWIPPRGEIKEETLFGEDAIQELCFSEAVGGIPSHPKLLDILKHIETNSSHISKSHFQGLPLVSSARVHRSAAGIVSYIIPHSTGMDMKTLFIDDIDKASHNTPYFYLVSLRSKELLQRAAELGVRFCGVLPGDDNDSYILIRSNPEMKIAIESSKKRVKPLTNIPKQDDQTLWN